MLKLTKVFHKTAQAYLDGYRYIILQGGTSASKTFSTLQLLTEIARKHKKQIDIVGLTVPHLKMGVLNDMPNVMNGFGLDFHALYNSSDKFYPFPQAGTINFLAVDKLGKAHGGRRDILYLNEANHHIWAIVEQLMIRTRDVIFIDYNPTNEFWVHEHIMNNPAEKGKWILIKSNYQDNQFLEESIIQSIEAKKGDGTSNFWRVYGMGELGVAEGLVFNNFEIANFDIYKFAKYRNGIDWGFSNDPFAFTRSAIENDTLYVCQEIYQRGLLNVDSAEMVKPIIRNEPVYCDSAEPKSVMEYNSLGINAHSAKKGPGSIEASIKKMQTFRNIVIHKDNCPNTAAEFKNYQWKKDKNGKQLPQPEDGMDHCLHPDTLITTSNGDVMIKDIQIGDMVLTRDGYKRVTFAGITARDEITYAVITASGKEIVGTANHRILTKRGFVRIDALRYGDIVLETMGAKTCRLKQLNMMDALGGVILKAKTQAIGLTSKIINGICTTMFGKSTMENDQRASIFTTLMGTRQTMIYQTSNLFPLKNIPRRTSRSVKKLCASLEGQILTEQECLLKHGIKRQKDTSGINKTPLNAGLGILTYLKEIVGNVQIVLNHSLTVNTFVQGLAKVLFGDKVGLMTLRQRARYAVTSLLKTNMPTHLLAAGSVVQVLERGKEKELYDLTVEGTPEFFANGILVHNCINSLWYALSMDTIYKKPSPIAKPYVKQNSYGGNSWMR